MISDILLNIVFFAEFSLNANFLRVGVIEVIFFTGNFNQKFSSTCCAFRMNDDFCLPKSCSSCCSQFNFSRSLRSMAVLSSWAQERRSSEIRARSARERAAKPREK